MIEEKDLIRRAGQGDSDAFRQLVETYQAPVYRLARVCAAAMRRWRRTRRRRRSWPHGGACPASAATAGSPHGCTA